jgi:hypothetical protein
LGFVFVYEIVKKVLKSDHFSAAVTFIPLLIVPILMAFQNWDDHDRSGRYTARDIGANYLKSTDKNAILFTYGDNDSFPLWYVQDVEGIRTDVRVSNLSYIQAGWYIEMMRQKAYESEPLPFSLGPEKYMEGKRTQMPVDNRVEKPVPVRQVVDFVGLDDRKAQVDISGRGDYLNFIPVSKIQLDVDPAKVLSNGTVKPYFRDSIVSPMIWEYADEDAFKGDLAIMDIFATSNWDRPLYFSTTVPSAQYKGLNKFFVQEGLAYRIVPVKTGNPEPGEFGMMDQIVMYENLMNKFEWGNAADPSVYLDENNKRMFSNFRRVFGNLGKRLLETGDTVKAMEVVRRGLAIVPPEKMPNDFFSIGFAEVLLRAGEKAEGENLVDEIFDYSASYLKYASSLRSDQRFGLDYTIGINMQSLIDIYRMSVNLNMKELSDRVEPELNKYYSILYSAGN